MTKVCKGHLVLSRVGHRLGLRAGILVDATGRSASPARRLGGRRVVHDRLVAVVAAADAATGGPGRDRRALVEAVEDGWWYSAPRGDGRGLALAYMTDADLLPRGRGGPGRGWGDWLKKAALTASRIGTGGSSGAVRLVAASSSRAGRIAGRGWLAAGDAAAARDPLCGQGVYRALESGLLAARAVDDALRGSRGALEDYARLVGAGFDAFLEERSESYGREGRWPDSPFWRRRRAIPRGSRSAP